MKNIEAEVRSFVTENQYKSLIKKFEREGKLVSKDNQITYYFNCKQDLRIQKNNKFCKIWLKKGKVHDELREETEIICDKKDFGRI